MSEEIKYDRRRFLGSAALTVAAATLPVNALDFLHNFYNYDVTAGKLVSVWSRPTGTSPLRLLQ